MVNRWGRLWLAFLRVIIVLLVLVLAGTLYLSFHPGLLIPYLTRLPGMVEVPVFSATPLPPLITESEGDLPGGYVAFTGVLEDREFACGFLLQLADGRLAGVGVAHTLPLTPVLAPARFTNPAGEQAAHLGRLVKKGRTFQQAHLTMDYSLWSVGQPLPEEGILRPDPRGTGQPGERVLVYGRFENGSGGSRAWEGTVMRLDEEAAWIQMDEFFVPYGFSGCPVVSQHTGRVIGMIVAGANREPLVIGLHPIGSLVEKIEISFR